MSDESNVVVAPDLQEKLQVLRKLVSIDNLLSLGLYPGGAAEQIADAKAFINSLHAPIMKEAEAHPDFEKVQTVGRGNV